METVVIYWAVAVASAISWLVLKIMTAYKENQQDARLLEASIIANPNANIRVEADKSISVFEDTTYTPKYLEDSSNTCDTVLRLSDAYRELDLADRQILPKNYITIHKSNGTNTLSSGPK